MILGNNPTISTLSSTASHLWPALESLRLARQEVMVHTRTTPERLPYDPGRVSDREMRVIDNYFMDLYNLFVFSDRNGLLSDDTLKQLEAIRPDQISEDALDSLIRSYLTLAQGRTLESVHTRRVGYYLNEIREGDIKVLSQVACQVSEAEYLLDKESSNEKVLSILATARDGIQSVRQRNNFDKLEYNLDLISKSLDATILLLNVKAKQLQIDESSTELLVIQPDDNLSTAMSHYIPNLHYAPSQEEHDGRNAAREQHVKPIIHTALSTIQGEQHIVGLGEADGRTSTLSFANAFPKAVIHAVEPDNGYFPDLVRNVKSHSNVIPHQVSMFNYKPDKSNSIAVVYSLGALTDGTPDQAELVRFLRMVRENWLIPEKGIFVIEEEIPPYYSDNELHGREKGLAIQRGQQIFNAMRRGIKTSRDLIDDELMALFSSLIPDKYGDYKQKLVDFERMFKEAGYREFHWVKIFPVSSDTYVNLPKDKLVIDKNYILPLGRKHTAVQIYNYAIAKLLNIDTTVSEPRKDMNYDMALQALLGLYDEVRKYDGAINRDELLKRDLGMEVVQGQTLSQGNDTTTDKTGGVYVLVATA